MIWRWCMAAGCLCLGAGMAGQAAAHPHEFIDTRLVVHLDDRGIDGFHQYWTFDELFSAWIKEDFDLDKDGRFNAAELETLYEQTFSNLENYGFFTRVLYRGKEIPVTQVQDFFVEIKNGRAVYSFFVPLAMDIPETREIVIAVYDETFYTQIMFPPEKIEFKGDLEGWRIDTASRKMPEFRFYYGMLIPTAVQITIGPP
jgi:ABC-type uncharacterized transport system substrate-binding protein